MTLTALVLAAGHSVRMGQPKMLLPWGKTTVLGQTLETLLSASIVDILVVTGGARDQVEEVSARYTVRAVYNPDHATGEMLSSIQVGLRALEALISPPEAALIVLGDQPQMEAFSVRAVAGRFEETRARLVVPSYRMRRGHPWVVARPLWEEIEAMRPPLSPRDFLNAHASEIEYVNVNGPSILADLDTPADYLKSRP